MKNKILSILIAVAVVLSTVTMLSVTVSAADMAFTIKEKNETKDTIQVEIGVSGNDGYAGLGFDVAYDSSVLEPVSVSVAGAADDAQMACMDVPGSGSYGVILYGDSDVKRDGSVCVVTFQKKSTAKNGTTAAFTVTSDDDNCYAADGSSRKVASGSATVKFDYVETTAKPTTTKAPATTKPVTNKPTTTKNQGSSQGNSSSNVTTNVNGATQPDEEMTTLPVEESTTEEHTTRVHVTKPHDDETEYESYSYDEDKDDEDEDDEDDEDTNNEDNSDNTKRIIAIAVIAVCIIAVIVLLLTRKKN